MRDKTTVNPFKSCRVAIMSLGGTMLFELVLYGLKPRDLMLVPTADTPYPVGGGIIRHALRKRGLDPDDFVASVFMIKPMPDRCYGQTVPREYENAPPHN